MLEKDSVRPRHSHYLSTGMTGMWLELSPIRTNFGYDPWLLALTLVDWDSLYVLLCFKLFW